MPRGGKHSGNKGRSSFHLPEADSSTSVGIFEKPICGKTASVIINGQQTHCRMPGSSKARGHRITYRPGDHVTVDKDGTITGRIDQRVWDSLAPIDDPTDPDSSYVFSDAAAKAVASVAKSSLGVAAPRTSAVEKTQQRMQFRQAERERTLQDRSGTGRQFTDPHFLASGAASGSSDDSDASSDDDLPFKPLNEKGIVAKTGKKDKKGKKGSADSGESKKANRVQPSVGLGVAAPSGPLVTPADLGAFDESDVDDI